MKVFVSESAVSRHSIESFMKFMLTLSMSAEFDYDPTYRRKITLWYRDSEEFIKRFRLPKIAIENCYNALLKQVDPNTDDPFDENILRVMDGMYAKRQSFAKELDLRKEDISFFNNIRLNYTKHSESAKRALTKNASRFGESSINSMFVSEHDDITKEKELLTKLVEKHTGMPGHELPVTQLQEWQKHAKETGDKKADHTKYLALRKHINTAFKTRLQSLIRSSGMDMLRVLDVRVTMEDEGIIHSIPEGFVGFIDDHGKYYTQGKKEMKTAPRGEVKMNPLYDYKTDNTYVCTILAPGSANEPSRAYTLSYAGASKQKKFGIVGKTLPKLPTLRKKWQPIMSELNTSQGVLATLVDFVDVTASRVSSDKASSHGSKTYGATTMLVKHVKIDASKMVVSYQGKSAGDQYHVVHYKGNRRLTRLVNNIKKLIKGKRPTDKVFALHGKGFTGNAVNKFMRSIGFPAGFTVHKFRTAVGIKMATGLLSKSKFKKNGDWREKDVNDWVKDQMMKIGEKLGHNSGGKITPNTAIQNYIEPDILNDFYNRLGIRPSATIQKAIDSIK